MSTPRQFEDDDEFDILAGPLANRRVGHPVLNRPPQPGAEPLAKNYFWAGENLTFEDACRHFVTVGSTGSGKSITLKMLIESVVAKIGSGDGTRRRALIYDAKADLVGFIQAANPKATVHIMNPLDTRFVPWDIAADITTETDAYEFASILIPRNPNENAPYFSDTARNLIAGVIKRFLAYPQFSVSEIKDPPGLARKLKANGEPFVAWLAEQLEPSLKQSLKGWDGGAKTEPPGLTRALALAFNRLLRRQDLWDNVRCAGIPLRAATAALVGTSQQGKELSIKNRLLLEDAFRDELAKCPSLEWPTGRGHWTLRDLIAAFASIKTLEAVLTHPATDYLLDHFGEKNLKNLAGVKSTVDNTLALYRPIAALCEAATSAPISLRKWVEESQESILVIGNHESAREATDTLNRLIFRQLSKFIIGRDGVVNNDETWIILDEVREAGELHGLRQLLLRGRSKGVAVALGFQDIQGMFAAYGEHEGAEIVGAAQNLVMLHINPAAPETAEWASSVFGSRRDKAQSISTTVGIDSGSQGDSTHIELVPNVLPIEFIQLRMPDAENGLKFYAFTPNRRAFHSRYTWAFLREKGPVGRPRAQKPDLIMQRDAESFELRPWNTIDHDRIGVATGEKIDTINR